ncbi:MAG: hypothetical protein ACOYLN_16770, partial [Blastocatellia bacterium]
MPEWEPSFLQGKEFEVLDRGKLNPAPGRRGMATDSGSAVSLKMELPEGAMAFLVARQESGAISFHMPQRGAARRGIGSAASAVVTFDVAVSQEPAESGRRGFFSKIVKVIVVKVVDAIAGKLMEKAAAAAVPFLAKAVEESLWSDRTQGWLRVTEQGLQG